jgi:hypothetical protein
MGNNIESEVQDMILKQRTHYENRRNLKRYPRTKEGRERYIKDSLEPRKINVVYSLVILLGLAGLILTLVWLIKGNDDPLQVPAIVLSMLVIIIGNLCLQDERRRK